MFPVNLFPYTNFHDLNLDWILNKIKEFEEEIKNISVPEDLLNDVSNLKTTVNSLQNSVTELTNLLVITNENVTYLNNNFNALEARVEVLEAGGIQSGSFTAFEI